LFQKSEGNRPLVIPTLKWEDDIRMDLTEIGWEGAHWMHLDDERGQLWATANIIMKIRVP